MARNSGRSSPNIHMVALSNGIVCDLRNALNMDSVTQGEMLVLKEFAALGLRRFGETLYKPVYTKNTDKKSVFIYAYERWYLVKDEDTIEDIINAFPQFGLVSVNWDHVSHNSRVIADRIKTMNNNHLPRLLTSPIHISFKNGQYDLVADVLTPYADLSTSGERSHFSVKAYQDHDMDICADLRDDQNFKTGIWYDIRKKCPNFFKVLAYQYPPEPVPIDANYNGYKTAELDLRIVLAFLGRLLVPINKFDMWQKAIGIFGTSGVGKTKVMEFFCDFFGNDVFNLKNNPEEMFGFETAIGKRVCIIEELSTKSNIPGVNTFLLYYICHCE